MILTGKFSKIERRDRNSLGKNEIMEIMKSIHKVKV